MTFYDEWMAELREYPGERGKAEPGGTLGDVMRDRWAKILSARAMRSYEQTEAMIDAATTFLGIPIEFIEPAAVSPR